MTHTYATLPVSAAAFDEIAAKFREAGYDHAFDGEAIDMHGVGLVRDPSISSPIFRHPETGELLSDPVAAPKEEALASLIRNANRWRDALAELVVLRGYRDTGLGMSLNDYTRRKPMAWEAARAALTWPTPSPKCNFHGTCPDAQEGTLLYAAPPTAQAAATHRAIGWMRTDGTLHKGCPPFNEPEGWEAVFTRGPLTDEQIDRIYDRDEFDTLDGTGFTLRQFARAIEAAHGIAASTTNQAGGAR